MVDQTETSGRKWAAQFRGTTRNTYTYFSAQWQWVEQANVGNAGTKMTSYVNYEVSSYFLPVAFEALVLWGGYIRLFGARVEIALQQHISPVSDLLPKTITVHLATLPILTPFTFCTMRLSLQSAVLTALGAVEVVSAFGFMPRDSGIDFADYPWQAPGPNDLRSPCPGLK